MCGAGAAGCCVVRRAARRHAALCGDVQHHIRAAQCARALPSLWLLCRAGCQALLLARCANVGLFLSELCCALACAHHGAQQAGAWAFLQEGYAKCMRLFAFGAASLSCPYELICSARGANSVEAWP